jgi:hypothetical protein
MFQWYECENRMEEYRQLEQLIHWTPIVKYKVETKNMVFMWNQ